MDKGENEIIRLALALSLASHLCDTRMPPSSWKNDRQRLDCKSTAMQQKDLSEAASFAFYSFFS